MPFQAFVGLADPLEGRRFGGVVLDAPLRAGGQVGVAALLQLVQLAVEGEAEVPRVRKTTPSTPGSNSAFGAPPPGPTSTMSWEKVVAKPEMGRAMIQERVFEKPGRLLVTMSVITPLGITV